MTKEEAENLKPGDVIYCCNQTRVLISSYIRNNNLGWRQEGSPNSHSYYIKGIKIISKKDAIINNYEIY